MFAQDKWKWRYDFRLAFRKRLTRLSVDPASAFPGAAYVLWSLVNKTLSGARIARRKACKCLGFAGKFIDPRPAGENPNGDAGI
jgi:hypothetical protein